MKISWNVVCFSVLFCALLGDCLGIAFVVTKTVRSIPDVVLLRFYKAAFFLVQMIGLLVIFLPKDKRGWTLNSAGYLLGPHAHQSLPDKGAVAGKRDAVEDLYSLGQDSVAPVLQLPDFGIFQTLMDFLSYLNLRDQTVIERLPLPVSEESVQQ